MTLGEALRVFMSGPDEDGREGAAALVLQTAQRMARGIFRDDAAADEAASRLVVRLLEMPPLEDNSDAVARAYIKTALTRSLIDRRKRAKPLVSIDEEQPVSDEDARDKKRIVLAAEVPEWDSLDAAWAREQLVEALEIVERRILPVAVDGSPTLRETWTWVDEIARGVATREQIIRGLGASAGPAAKRAAQNRFAQRVSRLFRTLDRRAADLFADEGWEPEQYKAVRFVLGDLRGRARI